MFPLMILILAGLVGVPQYFRRFRGSGTHWLYVAAALQLVLLAVSVLVAAIGVPATGPAWGVAATVSVAAAAAGGGPVTMAILRLAQRDAAAEVSAAADSDAAGPMDAHAPAAVASGMSRAGVLQGGAWIGLLERTAIAATLWSGWPEGLAIVLAVKGLGRYAELGKDGAAERFILGTFVSVLWACACTGTGVLSTG